ncbi:MAG: chitobiase/beta-hexosaminidase C-terminal domain-containing protein [Spirochaetes bacterium]|nr:chitobiase/beta-hexosaminidase C-terminal domain-containing protein [Spirochaetota bacterium]
MNRALFLAALLLAPLFAAFEGFPKPSDIFMRTLQVRVSNAADANDTRDAVSNFGVTRLEWVYWTKAEKDRLLLRDLKGKVTRFGGSLNPTQPPREGTAPYCRGLDGSTATVPWLRVYKNDRTNMCANHPDTLPSLSNHIAFQVGLGINAFQVDDVAMNVDVMRAAGGCFCDHCVAGFSRELAAKGKLTAYAREGRGDGKTFDIRSFLLSKGVKSGDGVWNDPRFPAELKRDFEAFQMASVKSFLPRLQATASALFGGPISFSKNTEADWLGGTFDYAMYELPWGNASPAYLYGFISHQRAIGGTVVFDGPKKFPMGEAELPTLRAAFATAYAAGGYAFVPWDMFTAPAKPRLFIRPSELGDLTTFIRACAPLLDGFNQLLEPWTGAAATNHLAADPMGDNSLAIFPHLASRQPGKEAVLHLVNWGKGRAVAPIQLDPRALLANPRSRIRVTQFTPKAFEAEAVGRAWATGRYGDLVEKKVLLEGALRPFDATVDSWSLLQVVALDGESGPAAPRLFPFGGKVLGSVSVEVEADGNGKSVYTLDGSDPRAGSKAVSGPIAISPGPGKSVILKVRSVEGSSFSPIAEARYTGEFILKARPGPGAMKPGTRYAYYEGEFEGLPDWGALAPTKSGSVEFFHQGPRPVETKAWAGKFDAWLKVPRTGRYRFWGFFNAQKGLVRLTVSDKEIFTAGKGSEQGRGEAVLEEGLHPISAEVVESHSDGSKGSHYFFIGMSGPGIPETRLTDAYLVHEPIQP